MVTTTAGTKRIAIDPVTRVEGHGKVTILLDERNEVRQARLHIVEFRGFERFVQGRPFWELPVLVQRLCGICPVSHHLCAAKTVDRFVGARQVPPTADKMRRLMHYGQTCQSHALHFFYLAAPDLLFGVDADPALRNIAGIIAKHPDLARQGVLMRKFGQEIIRLTAGKRVHGTGAIPGGINKNLSIEERDSLLLDIDQMMVWAREALQIARDQTARLLEARPDFATFESNHLALVGPSGELDLYDGGIRAIDASGNTIFDHLEPGRYAEFLTEEVRSWTYLKFPFIRSLGPRDGWYRVGPLSRICACDFIDTPEAEAARKEFMAAHGDRPSPESLAYHWARMIEVLHSIEKIGELLHDPDLQGEDLVTRGEGEREAVGVLEAPRGTLFHHYRINEHDQVEMANLIVATTGNNEAMNRAVECVARKYLSGQTITEALLNHIEVAIRAYDPCLSCATHALGQMPLVVELRDHEDSLISRRTRGGGHDAE